MNKLIISLATVFMLAFVSTANVLAKDGNSGRGGGGSSGGDENRVRVEVREDNSRIRVEIRGLDDEVEEAGLEVNGDTFEITGMVTDFTGDTATVDGTTIIINPSLVAEFEQEGTIEVGETIKVEGMVAPDGSFLAREVEANGIGHGP